MYYRYLSPKFEKKLGVRVHLVQALGWEAKFEMFEVRVSQSSGVRSSDFLGSFEVNWNVVQRSQTNYVPPYHHNNKVGTMPKALAGSRLAMFNGLAVVILPQKPTWPFDTVHYPQYMVLTRKFARVLFQNPVYSLSNSHLKMCVILGVSWDKSLLFQYFIQSV